MKIECIDVSYRYEVPGNEWAIRDISFALDQGEKVAVIGPAGSGKTTLIQLLDALILPEKGDIRYDGESVLTLAKSKKLYSVRRRIGVLFQFPEHQFFHETAYEELTFALKNFFDFDEQEIMRRAQDAAERFQLEIDMLKQTSPFHLSSGEKRKFALASALVSSPEVLILDEPTAGMDASGRAELTRIIAGLKDVTVVLITHNLEDFLGLIDRCIVLSRARLAADIPKNRIIHHLDDLSSMGAVPPLVLSVQDWLSREGVRLEDVAFDMEQLTRLLGTIVY
jgi:energy-coupling factor transport system ATP-binding protein